MTLPAGGPTVADVKDAAESQLSGEVSPRTSGGVIRYRLWPAKRHPFRTLFAAGLVVAATVATWMSFTSWMWAAIVLLGLTLGTAVFLFPTEVALDGAALHVRQLGTPRIYDLREFVRLEVLGDLLPRVELCWRPGISPVDKVSSVTVPLPADRAMADKVLVHLRKWVARRQTGRFEIDVDHAPEDTVDH